MIYYVPIAFSQITTLVVEADSQTEAVNIIIDAVRKNSKQLADKYDKAHIIEEEIYCEQDDDIVDSICKDFDLKEEKFLDLNGEIKTFFTHSVEAKDANVNTDKEIK